jgi:HEAT repeat protein
VPERFSHSYVVPLLLAFATFPRLSSAQPPTTSDLQAMLSAFVVARDLGQKEAILNRLTSRFGEAAGPGLLEVAIQADDVDTRWMAIRGIGYVKFQRAAPRLIEWLGSPEHYVRANAARALGEIRADSAKPLIELLTKETDSGVIEQTALALEMLHATEAVPALELRANHPSPQTRIWLVGAVDALGSRRELPFFAQRLYDEDIQVAAQAAAAIEHLTGQDFGFPKGHFGLCEVETAVMRARLWWELTKGR